MSTDLSKKVYGYHQLDRSLSDLSLEEKSPEGLVRYIMEDRGFEERGVRSLIALYPRQVLSKVYREFLKGLQTIGQRRALAGEGWDWW